MKNKLLVSWMHPVEAKDDFVLSPVKIASDVTDVAATDGESFLLKKDGTIWGCGLNSGKYAFNGNGHEVQSQLINIGFGVSK